MSSFATAALPSSSSPISSPNDSFDLTSQHAETQQLTTTMTATKMINTMTSHDATSSSSLPPSLRSLVDLATRHRVRSGGAGGGNNRITNKFVSTQDMKKRAAEKKKMREGGGEEEEEKQSTALVTTTMNHVASTSSLHSTYSAISPSSVTSAYARFQSLCAASSASSSSSSFPASLSTAFERTSHWARASAKRSERAGTLAWIYDKYARRIDDGDAGDASDPDSPATLSLLYSTPSLYSLSWSSLVAFFNDWCLIPDITTKQRLAILYQRFGVEEGGEGKARDVGVSYQGFLRVLAAVACEANMTSPATGSSATPSAAASSLIGISTLTPSQQVVSFLRHTRLSDLEHVSSRLSHFSARIAYRRRQEHEKERSVYVHRPRCLKKDGTSGVCECAQRPKWSEEDERTVVRGIQERAVAAAAAASATAHDPSEVIQAAASTKTKIMHIDPHRHQHDKSIRQKTEKKKESDAATEEEKTSSPITSSSTTPPFSSTELLAYNTLRKYECLPLEDTWCAYPGAYIDMGVIEVGPPVDEEGSTTTTASSPSSPAPRRHAYTLTIRNHIRSSLLLRISSSELPWLELSYTLSSATPYLALGMTQRLEIRPPSAMPSGMEKEMWSRREGVEMVGRIRVETVDQKTKEMAEAFVPVYARLVVKRE